MRTASFVFVAALVAACSSGSGSTGGGSSSSSGGGSSGSSSGTASSSSGSSSGGSTGSSSGTTSSSSSGSGSGSGSSSGSSSGGKDAGGDAAAGACSSPAQCGGGSSVCCGTIPLTGGSPPNCNNGDVKIACASASSCPTTLNASSCSGNQLVRLCTKNSDCTESNYNLCCTFPGGGGSSLTFCANQLIAGFGGGTCQ